MTRNIIRLVLMGLATGALVTGCVINSGDDPCKGITCDGHGTCLEDASGNAYCECDTSYHADALHCVFDGYSVDFTWSLSDGKSCTQALVGDVKVEFLESDTVLASANYDCSVGGATVSELDDGNYTIDLTAMGNNSEDFYFGSQDVTVSGQDVDIGDIELDPIGYIRFQWDFEGMDCLTADVIGVRVKVLSEDETETLYEADPVPDCDEGEHQIGNFFMGRYTLQIEGVCGSDYNVGFSYNAFIDIERTGENNFGLISLVDVGGC